MLTYQISAIDHGRRAESFLQNLMPSAPLSYLRKIIKGENLTINGNIAATGTILRQTDTAALKETAKTKNFLDSSGNMPDILLEDEQLIIFNKPSGLPVHSSAEHGGENLMERAMEFLADRDKNSCKLYPVNRLDKGTSGAVMAAKNRIAAGHYGKLFQESLVEKCYLALISGSMNDEGIIDVPLDGKDAVTTYRTLFRGETTSLLSVHPLTGRTHQIRRHFAAKGHPLIGDKRYGGKEIRGFNGDALHAWMLSYSDPFSQCDMIVHAPLSRLFLENLETLAGDSAHAILNSLLEY